MRRLAQAERILRVVLDPGLLAWSVGQTLAWPIERLKPILRRGRRHEGEPRWAVDERGALVDPAATARLLARPGPHVVLTGLGYGEFVMMKRVIDGVRAVRPDVAVSVALRHREAMEHVRAQHPDLNVCRWPHDGILAVSRWLAALRPDVVTLIEGYHHPALVVGSARYGARVALLNGRCRDRTSFHHPLLRLPHRWLFRAYSAIAMRQEDSVAAVRGLVRPDCDLLASGDLKTDFRPVELSEESRSDLRSWLASDRPIVAAGSTDNLDEERTVVAAFLQARAETPCVLLLAPRQPKLAEGLAEMLREHGLTFARRSEGAHGPVDVLLLDSQGELSNAYAACAAAYVGGSHPPRGNGHNPIEPLAVGVPIAYGPRRGHFAAIQLMVEEAGVGLRVADAEELAAFWIRFLCDPEERARVGEAGRRIVEENRGAVARTVEMLVRLLPDQD